MMASSGLIRLAETDGEPRFLSVSELESVFNREDEVLFARHRRRSIVGTLVKSHRNSSSKKTGRATRGAHLDTPTIAEVAPLPERHERGEGWGEELVPSNCRAL